MIALRLHIALLLLAALASGCSRDEPSPQATEAPKGITGTVSKGPLQNAFVDFFNVDIAGAKAGTVPLATVTTDSQGRFSVGAGVLPAGAPILAVTRNGEYVDESDPATGTSRRRIVFGPTEGLEAVLPPDATSVAITPYSMALLKKARLQANGANFANVYAAVRVQATAAFGFDPITTAPADPLTGAGGSQAYGLLLGAAAMTINRIAGTATPEHMPGYADVIAFVDDLAVPPLDAADLDEMLRRFRNNNIGAYGGAPAPTVDQAALAQPAQTLPTISAIADLGVGESTSTGPIAFTIADSEDAATALVLTGSSSNTVLVPNANIVFGGSGGSPTVTVTPANGVSGSTTITVTVTDTAGGSATETFVLTVAGFNDPPVINSTAPSTATEDTLYTYNATVADPDGPAPLWSLAGTHTCGGAINSSSGVFTFTPAGPVPVLSCVLAIQVSDGGSTDTQSTTVNVTPVNDAPAINSTVPPNATEDVLYSYDASVDDSDGPTATWAVAAGDDCGGTIVPSTGVYTFTPAGPTPPASCTVAIQVSDGGAPVVQSGTVTIAAVNDPPVAIDDTGNTDEDVNFVVSEATLVANDTDVDGPALSVTAVGAFSNGTAVLSAGSVTFTPTANFNGTGSFDYTVSDGTSTDTGTVTITIAAVNDPPSFTSPTTESSPEDAGARTVSSFATFISAGPPDESGQSVTFTANNNNPSLFSVPPSVDPSGTLTYTAAPNEYGTAEVDIFATDDGATTLPNVHVSGTTTVMLTVAPVSDPPTAVGFASTSNEDTLHVYAPLDFGFSDAADAAGDGTDVDNFAFVIVVGLPSSGTLVLNDGVFDQDILTVPTVIPVSDVGLSRFKFRPDPDESGIPYTAWTFSLRDSGSPGANTTGVYVATVNVTPVNDAPAAVDDFYTTPAGVTLNVSAPGVLANDSDPDLDGISVNSVSPSPTANGGVFSLNGDGSFSYTPGPGFTGVDTFTYANWDGTVPSNTATVTITVGAIADQQILGSWRFLDYNATSGNNGAAAFTYREELLSFLPGGIYLLGNNLQLVTPGDCDAPGAPASSTDATGASVAGIEYGNYSWDPDSGSFNVRPMRRETDGFCGLNEPETGSTNDVQLLAVTGDILTFTYDDASQVRYQRVTSTPGTLSGAFLFDNSLNTDKPLVFAFMPVSATNGRYIMVDAEGGDVAPDLGVEFGCYDIDISGDWTTDNNPVSCPNAVNTNNDAGIDGTVLATGLRFTPVGANTLQVQVTAEGFVGHLSRLPLPGDGTRYLPYRAGDHKLSVIDPRVSMTPQIVDNGPVPEGIGSGPDSYRTLYAGEVRAGGHLVNVRIARLAYLKDGQVFIANLDTGAPGEQISTIDDACAFEDSFEDFANVDDSVLYVATQGPDASCDQPNVIRMIRANADPGADSGIAIGIVDQVVRELRGSTGAITGFITRESDVLYRRDSNFSNAAAIPGGSLAAGHGFVEAESQGLGKVYLTFIPSGGGPMQLHRYDTDPGVLTTNLYPFAESTSGFLEVANHDADHLYFADGNDIRRIPHDASSAASGQLVVDLGGAAAPRGTLDITASRVVFKSDDGVFSGPKSGGSAIPLRFRGVDEEVESFYVHANGRVYINIVQSPGGIFGQERSLLINDDGTGGAEQPDSIYAGGVRATQFDLDTQQDLPGQQLVRSLHDGAGGETLELIDPATGVVVRALGNLVNVDLPRGLTAQGVGRYAGVDARYNANQFNDTHLLDLLRPLPITPVAADGGVEEHWLFFERDGGGGVDPDVLLGAWAMYDDVNEELLTERTLTFFAGGKYLYGGHDNDPNCDTDLGTDPSQTGNASDADGNGIEYGTYSWDTSSGNFQTFAPIRETNGTCGLYSPGPGATNQLNLVIENGDTLAFSDGGGTFRFRRVPSNPGLVEGAFLADGTLAANGPVVIAYFPDPVIVGTGRYFFADGSDYDLPSGTTPGIEEGCYTLNASPPFEFVVDHSVACANAIDTNDEAGFIGDPTPADFTLHAITGEKLRLTASDEPLPYGLTRLPLSPDDDADGLSNFEEGAFGTDPGNPDTDFDGLNDGDEVVYGTDPNNPDSDGDSDSDGAEIAAGSDPNNFNDRIGNDAPFQSSNGQLFVNEGDSEALTGYLEVLDHDDGPETLTYNIGPGPTQGYLYDILDPLTAIFTFTQADIDSGFVRYQHTSDTDDPDSFVFAVTDSGFLATTPATDTFSIAVFGSNDAPSVTLTPQVPVPVSLPINSVSPAIVLSDLIDVAVADPDSGANTVRVTLSLSRADAGTLTLDFAGPPLNIVINDADTVIIDGPIADLDSYFNPGGEALSYVPAPGAPYTGPMTLSVAIDDQGWTSGAPLQDSDAVALTFDRFELSGLPNADEGLAVRDGGVNDGTGDNVAGGGDFNGDGYEDFVIGAQLADPQSRSTAGETYVVFGTPSGFPSDLVVPGDLDGFNGFKVEGAAADDRSGNGVAINGDFNGDGLDDLVIGAPNHDVTPSDNVGRVYVLFGRSNPMPAIVDLASGGAASVVINGAISGADTGWSVAHAGDLNGDGIGDLAIGAPQFGTAGASAAYVVFGRTVNQALACDGVCYSVNLAALTGADGFTMSQGPLSGHETGWAVAGAGDVNGDGLDDVVVGSTRGSPNPGSAFVIFGSTAAYPATVDLTALNGSDGFVFNGDTSNDIAGYAVGGLDLNGDSFSDVVVGVLSGPGPLAYNCGYAAVIYGKAGGFAASYSLVDMDGTEGFQITSTNVDADDCEISGSIAAGDVNGDGRDDLLLGVASAFDRPGDGRQAVIFGADSFGALFDLEDLDGNNGFRINGADDDGVGYAAAAGDFNGDGFADIHLGASGTDSAYTVYGGNFTRQPMVLGTGLNDPGLFGDGGNNIINGSRGDDAVFGGGGDDVLLGGSGNDRLTASVVYGRRVDGGRGVDQLEPLGDFDFTAFNATRHYSVYRNFEHLVLNGGNTVNLGVADVRRMTSSPHTLQVNQGGNSDFLTSGDAWLLKQVVSRCADEVFGSCTNEPYVQYANGQVKLEVEQDAGSPPPFPIDRFGIPVAFDWKRFSQNQNGSELGTQSRAPMISGDGRYAVFMSTSSVSGQPLAGGFPQVYRAELETGAVVMVSQLSGVAGDASSIDPSISHDGRYVAFRTHAGNLGVAVSGIGPSVARWDAADGSLALVSDDGGSPFQTTSGRPAISADGRYVAFLGDTLSGEQKVWRVDMNNPGVPQIVSIDGGNSRCDSSNPCLSVSMSGDGRFIAWDTQKNNPDLVDANGLVDVYLRDMNGGTAIAVSAGGDGPSSQPALSSDGRRLAFRSQASNLGVPDGNGRADIYVYDVPSTGMARASTTASGGELAGGGDPGADAPALSGDGRVLIYAGVPNAQIAPITGTDYVPIVKVLGAVSSGNHTGAILPGVYTVQGGGPLADGGIYDIPSLSFDGTRLAFASISTNLVKGDANSMVDIFGATNPLFVEGIALDDSIDSDGDGLDNGTERDLGTYPVDVDSDNDGLNDFDEVNRDGDASTYDDTYSSPTTTDTDPLDADTDDDGYGDGEEIAEGTDPNDAGSFPVPFAMSAAGSHAVGQGPLDLASADLDRDGKLDLVTVDQQGNAVSILLGNGSGSFAGAYGYNVGSFPISVALADFDSDGAIDMAVTNIGSGDVSLLQGAGDGTFSPSGSISLGTSPFGIAAADFDRDGSLDLVVTSQFNSYLWFVPGNGNGTFGSPTTVNADAAQRMVAVDDLDADGNLDLVVTMDASPFVALLLGNGNGSFGPASTFPVGTDPRGVRIADLDRDGKLDVVVANQGSSDVTVLLGTGTGTFVLPTTYPAASGAFGLALDDLDGDGIVDIATAGIAGSDVALLKGDGSGVFEPTQYVPAGAGPSAVVLEDFDQDGRIDVAASNFSGNDVSILLNQTVVAPAGSFVPEALNSTDLNPAAVAVADFNRDGKLDWVTANAGGNNASVLLGDGTGGVTSRVDYATGSNSVAVAVGDLNRDGDLDFVVGNQSGSDLAVWLGDGVGGFSSAGPNVSLPNGPPGAIVLDDLNNDGILDVATPSSTQVAVRLGNGAGGFGSVTSFNTSGSNARAVAAADFDHDGILDLAVPNYGSGDVSVLFGNGVGGFVGATTHAAGTNPNGVAVGDFNDDGHPDLAVTNYSSNDVSILLGDGLGGFGSATNYAAGGAAYAAQAADMNRDGKLDLVVARYSGGGDAATVLFGDGTGGFGAPTSLPIASNASESVAVGDFNRDGRPDIAIAAFLDHVVAVILNN